MEKLSGLILSIKYKTTKLFSRILIIYQQRALERLCRSLFNTQNMPFFLIKYLVLRAVEKSAILLCLYFLPGTVTYCFSGRQARVLK